MSTTTIRAKQTNFAAALQVAADRGLGSDVDQSRVSHAVRTLSLNGDRAGFGAFLSAFPGRYDDMGAVMDAARGVNRR